MSGPARFFAHVVILPFLPLNSQKTGVETPLGIRHIFPHKRMRTKFCAKEEHVKVR